MPALTRTGWKKSSRPVQGWGAVHFGPDLSSYWINSRGQRHRPLRPLQGSSPYVFTTEAGTPVTTAWFLRMVKRTGEAAKLPFPHPHVLRHSTGYKLANQGEDTRSLAHYLGIEIYIDGFTSFDVWSPRSAPSNDARARSSARAHRPARIAVYIPASFQCGPSLDPTESEQVCALCREAFRSQTA